MTRITSAQYHAVVSTLLDLRKDDASIPPAIVSQLSALMGGVAARQHVIDQARGVHTRPYTLQGAVDDADAVLDGIASATHMAEKAITIGERISREAELLADMPPFQAAPIRAT